MDLTSLPLDAQKACVQAHVLVALAAVKEGGDMTRELGTGTPFAVLMEQGARTKSRIFASSVAQEPALAGLATVSDEDFEPAIARVFGTWTKTRASRVVEIGASMRGERIAFVATTSLLGERREPKQSDITAAIVESTEVTGHIVRAVDAAAAVFGDPSRAVARSRSAAANLGVSTLFSILQHDFAVPDRRPTKDTLLRFFENEQGQPTSAMNELSAKGFGVGVEAKGWAPLRL